MTPEYSYDFHDDELEDDGLCGEIDNVDDEPDVDCEPEEDLEPTDPALIAAARERLRRKGSTPGKLRWAESGYRIAVRLLNQIGTENRGDA